MNLIILEDDLRELIQSLIDAQALLMDDAARSRDIHFDDRHELAMRLRNEYFQGHGNRPLI